MTKKIALSAVLAISALGMACGTPASNNANGTNGANTNRATTTAVNANQAAVNANQMATNANMKAENANAAASDNKPVNSAASNNKMDMTNKPANTNKP